jgi:hypothetical protein
MSFLDDRPNPPAPYDRLWQSRWDIEQLAALERPATKREIAERLALLLKSFPNAGTADAEVYGGCLLQDVADTQPSIGDIEETCRQIRRVSKFLPTISEILEVLAEAKYQRVLVARHAQPTPKSISKTRPAGYLAHNQTLPSTFVGELDPTAVPL